MRLWGVRWSPRFATCSSAYSSLASPLCMFIWQSHLLHWRHTWRMRNTLRIRNKCKGCARLRHAMPRPTACLCLYLTRPLPSPPPLPCPFQLFPLLLTNKCSLCELVRACACFRLHPFANFFYYCTINKILCKHTDIIFPLVLFFLLFFPRNFHSNSRN